MEARGLHFINVDHAFFHLNVASYVRAARGMRKKIGSQNITLSPEVVHPLTHMRFRVPLTVDGVAYVSMHAVERRQHAHLYHKLAALMDPRRRVSISQVVFGTPPLQTELADRGTLGPHSNATYRWRMVHALAIVANIRISNMVVGFDLEWNNNDPRTRFLSGVIVDAHFHEISTGWVIFSGYLQVPHDTRLSKFLLEHGYTVEALRQRGQSPETLKARLADLAVVTEHPLFVAYSGINSDINVLYNNNIHLDAYVDASVALNGGRSVALITLYRREFGEEFSAHGAAADTIAMIRLLKHRGIDGAALWALFRALMQTQAYKHMGAELGEAQAQAALAQPQAAKRIHNWTLN
jgi:hypothetical protein